MPNQRPSMKKTHTYEKTSILLNRIANELEGDKIKLGLLLYRLRRRSYGGLLLILSIVSLVPGISVLAGILMLLLSIQIAIGYKSPSIPKFFGRYCLRVTQLKAFLSKGKLSIEKVEKFVKPRMVFLTAPPVTLLIGCLIFFLAALLIIPIPFSNLLPAICIALFSLGLLERDGSMIIAGFLLSVFAFLIGGFAIYVSVLGIERAFA